MDYEYAYKSIDLNRIMGLCAGDKMAEAMEFCADLVKPPLPDDTAERSMIRAAVGQEVMQEISTKIMAIKKSPAASAPAIP